MVQSHPVFRRCLHNTLPTPDLCV
uniref:Uncharacterized protein n=1 Tax=Anguilla anguilla TaxID=7936 RepID=A0A0E9RC89_ANGAN